MLIVGSSSINSNKIPIVTVMLMIATIAFFVKSYCLEVVAYNDLSGHGRSAERFAELQEFFDFWGFQISDFKKGEFHSVFSNIFVHGGLMHIVGNMLAFWAFAIALEELFGGIGFILFYLGVGVASCIAQGIFLTGSDVPIIGASGAVAGMMGAYAVLLGYSAKVKVLVWFFGYRIIHVPAPAFACLWVFPQLIDISENGIVDGGGVALVSHIAGFALGAVIGLAMKPATKKRICEQADGSLSIKVKDKGATKQEQEILDEILAMRPFSEVVETLGNCDIACPECGEPLDLKATVAERLVKCKNDACTKMTYIDGELLASQM